MKFGYVKVGAYTPKIRVADVEYNVGEIIRGIDEGADKGAEVLVFPELCITGYTAGDLFYSDVLLNAAAQGLKKIANHTRGLKMLAFIGLPFRSGNLIYNVAAAVNDGKVLAFIPKSYLPNYNEFYEKRQFAPAFGENSEVDFFGETVSFGTRIILYDGNYPSVRVAAEICEDLWVAKPPSAEHALNGANIIVNLSCSNETVGKKEYRTQLVKSHSARLNCAYVYADAGEGESTSDLIFGGHDLIAENGKILGESELFSCGLTLAEADAGYLDYIRTKSFNQPFDCGSGYVKVKFNACTDSLPSRIYRKTPFVPEGREKIESRARLILEMQAEGLKKRLSHTRAGAAVIGLSGGLDSTLALLVAVTAMKKLNRNLKDVIAVTMPCFGTTSRTFLNSVKLAKSLKVTLKKIDVSKSVKRHLKDIGHPEGETDVTFENAQARERTQVLMDIANMHGGLVVGTGDLSEAALGWATYNGDHMSMYAVNASIPKTLVRFLVGSVAENSRGKLKNVLYDILDTPVSPELLPAENGKISQKTEDIVGPYELHDFFLYHFIRNGFSPEKIFYIACLSFKDDYNRETILKWLKTFFRRFFSQQFKRSCVPDGVKVGSVALSPRGDWRMPSDAESSLWLRQLEDLK